MGLFDSLTQDIAGRFGIAERAGALLYETVSLIDREPEGLDGFIDSFGAAGVPVGSWLGRGDAPAIPVSDLEGVLGADTLSRVAARSTVSPPVATEAVAYSIPKIVGLLTPGEYGSASGVSYAAAAPAGTIEGLAQDVAARFGLGDRAAPLMQETAAFIGRAKGGVQGFLAAFRNGSAPVDSWLGRPDAPAVPLPVLERAWGADTLTGIAARVGVGSSTGKEAMAYAIPKIVGILTPRGAAAA